VALQLVLVDPARRGAATSPARSDPCKADERYTPSQIKRRAAFRHRHPWPLLGVVGDMRGGPT
jgi:hypothetical protein